jgi:hypothetical protein
MSKPTFKKHIPVGRYRSFEPHHTDIKITGHVVGSIGGCQEDALTRVSFAVKDANAHSGWKWIRLKRTFKSEPEARQFVTDMWLKIIAQWPLHQFPKD